MDLTAKSDGRGQMILLAAIGLAVLLTLMALTLNTAVVGEIHAAETDASSKAERGAIQYQYSVDRGIRGLLVQINREFDEYETLASELEGEIAAWSTLSGSERIRDGKTTNASLESVTYDTRILHNESGEFRDHSGNTTWIVADDVSDVRGFEMNVSKDELVETRDCTGVNECLSLYVEGSDGAAWELFVHDDAGVTITVVEADGSNETYGPAGTSSKLNITSGVFDPGGSEEEFTTFLEDELSKPYTLTYTNANNVTGTYVLAVDGKIVEETIDDDARYGVEEAPKIQARIVAADVGVRYRSADLTYETEIEILPGETDE